MAVIPFQMFYLLTKFISTMKLKLRNQFSAMSDPDFERSMFGIINSIAENVHFPNPLPEVTFMENLATEFSLALNQCKTGDRANIALKNAKRKVLEEHIAQWRMYVLLTSNEDRTKASTSGFDLVPERAPRPPLTKPEALKVSNGINRGELVFKAVRVQNAIGYVFEYTTLEGLTSDQWKSIPSSKTTQVSPALTRGTLYYCRVGAIGANNQLVYSDVISHTAA